MMLRALHLEMTPGNTWVIIWDIEVQTQIGCLHGKYPTCCAISWVPVLFSYHCGASASEPFIGIWITTSGASSKVFSVHLLPSLLCFFHPWCSGLISPGSAL